MKKQIKIMIYFKLKKSLKKKSILLTFLIVCSLSISENALAHYGLDCCSVVSYPHNQSIQMNFKFFEYNILGKCSYTKNVEILYSTDNGASFTHLMSVSSESQTSKTWAWIDCKNKKKFEKITLSAKPHDRSKFDGELNWRGDTRPRIEVDALKNGNINFGAEWYPQHAVTNIRFKIKWYNCTYNRTEDITFDYKGCLIYQDWAVKKY